MADARLRRLGISNRGANRVIISLDADLIDKGLIQEYINWLKNNPGKSVGGHGGGNLNGEADLEQQNYKQNKKYAYEKNIFYLYGFSINQFVRRAI